MVGLKCRNIGLFVNFVARFNEAERSLGKVKKNRDFRSAVSHARVLGGPISGKGLLAVFAAR